MTSNQVTALADEAAIIPYPLELIAEKGAFALTSTVKILVQQDSSAAKEAGHYLQQALNRPAGLNLTIAESDSKQTAPGAILLTTVGADPDSGEEGYQLHIAPDSIQMRATTAAGLFYGVQTLLQLLPPRVYSPTAPAIAIEWEWPCLRINDRPRFRWRGVMLDVSRHLVGIDDILRYLDCLAMHKINIFHWHLTDDQGWRIQSLKYPRLTEVGAWRKGSDGRLYPEGHLPTFEPPGRYGGFYTQEQVREIVACAAQRHIAVVPEIEMPGHALAALAAYPQLSCAGGPFEVSIQCGVCHEVYCAGNEQTFDFLQNVLDELLPLFPSPYVHIGGDECPKDRWKNCPKCQARIHQEGLADENALQSYFIRRIEKFLNSRGKRLIGWDEILEGGLAPNATVMSWRGIEGGIAAAKAGHDVVMSPTSHCYLDHYQAPQGEPKAFGGLLTLETAYSFEPIPPEFDASQSRHVLGLQGNVWTEYMPDMRQVEYMTWPRAAALAEVGWTAVSRKKWADFQRRIATDLQRLRTRGATFRPLDRQES
jgi:hexosaminidase